MAEKFGCYQIDHERGTSIGHVEETQIISRLDSDVKLNRNIYSRTFWNGRDKGKS